MSALEAARLTAATAKTDRPGAGAPRSQKGRTLMQFEPSDLHRAVLYILPNEGEKLGYHPIVRSVKLVRDELNKPLPSNIPPLTSPDVSTAVRQLNLAGLAKPVKSGGNVLGWQRTRAGAMLVRDYVPPTFDTPYEEGS